MFFVSKCIKKIFYYYFLKIIFDINTSKQFKNIKTKINLNFYETWFESRYQKKISLRKKQGRRFCQQIQLVRDPPLEPKFMGGL